MVDVDVLDERSHLDSALDRLLGVVLGDLKRVSVDADDEGMGVASGVGTVLINVQDDRLASSVASSEHDDNPAPLHKLA